MSSRWALWTKRSFMSPINMKTNKCHSHHMSCLLSLLRCRPPSLSVMSSRWALWKEKNIRSPINQKKINEFHSHHPLCLLSLLSRCPSLSSSFPKGEPSPILSIFFFSTVQFLCYVLFFLIKLPKLTPNHCFTCWAFRLYAIFAKKNF